MLTGIELREIRTFLVLAEELHFGRAAERLIVSPSRVSQIIRTLETRIGGRLFSRESRRVTLTVLGEEMLERVSPAYQQLCQALALTRESSSGITGEVRFGTYAHLNGGPNLLAIITLFEARHPRCRVVTRDTGFDRDQLDWLRSGDLDVLALRLPLNDRTVTIGPLLSREERVVVVAAEHPLAKQESIDWEDLADYAVSDSPTLPRETVDAFIPPRTHSGKVLRRMTNHSMHGLLLDIARGNLVHPTVPSFIEHYPHAGVTSVPLHGLPPSETALVWFTAATSPAIEALACAAAEFAPPASPVAP